MIKKILFTSYLLAITATPVHALPYWAKAIARSHCEYMALGIDWDKALEQSLYDNSVWDAEFTRDTELSAAILTRAAVQLCPNIYHQSFEQYERQKSAPAFRNQELQVF